MELTLPLFLKWMKVEIALILFLAGHFLFQKLRNEQAAISGKVSYLIASLACILLWLQTNDSSSSLSYDWWRVEPALYWLKIPLYLLFLLSIRWKSCSKYHDWFILIFFSLGFHFSEHRSILLLFFGLNVPLVYFLSPERYRKVVSTLLLAGLLACLAFLTQDSRQLYFLLSLTLFCSSFLILSFCETALDRAKARLDQLRSYLCFYCVSLLYLASLFLLFHLPGSARQDLLFLLKIYWFWILLSALFKSSLPSYKRSTSLLLSISVLSFLFTANYCDLHLALGLLICAGVCLSFAQLFLIYNQESLQSQLTLIFIASILPLAAYFGDFLSIEQPWNTVPITCTLFLLQLLLAARLTYKLIKSKTRLQWSLVILCLLPSLFWFQLKDHSPRVNQLLIENYIEERQARESNETAP